MNLFEELRALGVDVDDGMKRLMGNEKLYRKLFGVICEDDRFTDPGGGGFR